MNSPVTSIVVAHGENRDIGGNNQLLWRLPGDLARFKAVALGHPIIMGRTTYESIGRALPGRLNIVITRNPGFHANGVTTVSTLEEAIDIAKQNDGNEIFIIGGGEIFRQVMPLVNRIYLTKVKQQLPDGDIFFPEYTEFELVAPAETGEENGLSYEYQVWERKS